MAIIDDELFKQLLLGHLLRCPAVIEKASNVLSPDDFNQAGEQTYRLIWSLSKDWYAKHRTLIPQNVLIIELRTALGEAMSMFSSEEVTAMWALVPTLYSLPETELAAEWALEHLQTFLDERKLKPLLQQAASMGAGADFNEVLSKLSTTQSDNRLSSLTSLNVVDVSRIQLASLDRTETGVLYVDKLLDGGIYPGEFYGLLAPTGGGKTTTGINLVVEGARKGLNVAYFSYEVELVPEITSRMYAIAGNIPRSIMKTIRTVDDLPTAHKADLLANLERCGKGMHLFDMKKDMHRGVGTKGPVEIRNKLRECNQEGKHIDLVVVDQLLSAADPWMLSQGGKIDNRRIYLDMFTEQLRDVAQEMKCGLMVLHQVDNVAKKFRPTQKPKQGQAAEMKSFENNTHFTFQFGTPDPLGRSWCVTTKHRSSSGVDLIVQHDPTYWKINWEQDRYTVDSDGFVDHLQENKERQMHSAASADHAARPSIKLSADA